MIKHINFKTNKVEDRADVTYLANLPENVDEKAINLYRYVYLSNQRQGNANTKTKAQVSGGGRKPFAQKGTGRARAGSIRSPMWRGGGKAHGPTSDVNYKLKLNKKFGAYVLQNLFKLKMNNNAIFSFESLDKLFEEKPSVKQAIKVIEDNQISAKSLFIVSKPDKNLISSFNGLDTSVKVVLASEVSGYEILNSKQIYIANDTETEDFILKRINK